MVQHLSVYKIEGCIPVTLALYHLHFRFVSITLMVRIMAKRITRPHAVLHGIDHRLNDSRDASCSFFNWWIQARVYADGLAGVDGLRLKERPFFLAFGSLKFYMLILCLSKKIGAKGFYSSSISGCVPTIIDVG